MKVIYLDDETPRVDHHPGKPGGVTVGKDYEVLEVDGFFFRIINDHGKSARYISQRFAVVEE